MNTIAQVLADTLNGPHPPDWYETIDALDPTYTPEDDYWGTREGDSVTFSDLSTLTLWPGHFGGDWVPGYAGPSAMIRVEDDPTEHREGHLTVTVRPDYSGDIPGFRLDDGRVTVEVGCIRRISDAVWWWWTQ